MPLFNDSTTWIAVGLAFGAAGLALVLLGLLVLALVRGRRSPGAAPAETLPAPATAALEAKVRGLTGELEAAREEARRSRQLALVFGSIELDTVLERTLEAAVSLLGIDAAMIVLAEPAGSDSSKPIVASVGLTAEESAHPPVSGCLEGRDSRAVAIQYRHPEGRPRDPGTIQGGLALPLAGEDVEPIGALTVFWRTERLAGIEDDLARVEELAASAGPALENARRFREARLLADLDALTSLHNRRFFHETLGREVSRAQRYGRALTLLVLDLDDFKTINDRVGHLAGDTLLAEIGERIRSVVRGADVACRIGGDEFAVVLPEAGRTDAEQLYRRLQVAVASRPVGPTDRLHLSAGIAELLPEDDAEGLFKRADDALYRAKESGKGRAVTAERRP